VNLDYVVVCLDLDSKAYSYCCKKSINGILYKMFCEIVFYNNGINNSYSFLKIRLTLSLLIAARVASGSSENSVGTGPARVSPSNIWQLIGQDPSFTVGMLSLEVYREL
jgi:hypothetical protein